MALGLVFFVRKVSLIPWFFGFQAYFGVLGVVGEVLVVVLGFVDEVVTCVVWVTTVLLSSSWCKGVEDFVL